MNRLLVSAAALLLGALPIHAQSLVTGKVQTGTPSYVNDQNVPLSLDATGALKVTGGAAAAPGGSVTAPGTSGSQAQAVQGINGGVPLPIQGGNGTAVKTDGSGTTQPVSATSLPLPTGASTEGTLQTVATSNTAISTATGTQADAATASGANTSIIGALRAIRDRLLATVTISGTIASNTQVNGLAISPTNPAPTVEAGSSSAGAGIAPVITQSGTAVVGKTSQGNLYSAYAINTTTTAGYLVCINATAAPTAGAAITPVDVATLAGTIGATATINYGAGPANGYSAGITCLVTTSLTTYTAGGASFMQARVR